MNSEHISAKDIRKHYGLEIIEKCAEKDKYKFKLFDSEIIKNIYSITNSLRKLYDIENIATLYGDHIDNYYIKNNCIWFRVSTNDGNEFDTDIGGYQKRHLNRNNFIDTVAQNGDKLLSAYVDSHTPVFIDHGCGHQPHKVIPNNYINGSINCPICSHSIIIPYVNDCYTLRPDLVKYFKNESDAIGIAVHDHNYREFYCPICGQPKTTKLTNIASFGFSCNYCSDGISYPEKIMRNVLTQLGLSFTTQETFDWGFYYDDNCERHRCRYDFVIHDDHRIIETDGGFHYDECESINAALTLEERQKIDRIKDKLATENGYSIVRIDCNYCNVLNRFDYIKQSIINALHTIYDLNSINWVEADRLSEESIVELACILWESNNRITTLEIADRLDTNVTSIIQYLKIGMAIGLCKTYSKEMSNKRQAKKQVCGILYIYKSNRRSN